MTDGTAAFAFESMHVIIKRPARTLFPSRLAQRTTFLEYPGSASKSKGKPINF